MSLFAHINEAFKESINEGKSDIKPFKKLKGGEKVYDQRGKERGIIAFAIKGSDALQNTSTKDEVKRMIADGDFTYDDVDNLNFVVVKGINTIGRETKETWLYDGPGSYSVIAYKKGAKATNLKPGTVVDIARWTGGESIEKYLVIGKKNLAVLYDARENILKDEIVQLDITDGSFSVSTSKPPRSLKISFVETLKPSFNEVHVTLRKLKIDTEYDIKPEHLKYLKGEDYNGSKGKIVDAAYVKDWKKLTKYDTSGWLDQDALDEYELERDDILVAFNDGKETNVYTFGDGGVDLVESLQTANRIVRLVEGAKSGGQDSFDAWSTEDIRSDLLTSNTKWSRNEIKKMSRNQLIDAVMSMPSIDESSKPKEGDDKEYDVYFAKMLKKNGYKSVGDIPKDKKDDFFKAVDKGWKSDDEGSNEGLNEGVFDFIRGKRSMRVQEPIELTDAKTGEKFWSDNVMIADVEGKMVKVIQYGKYNSPNYVTKKDAKRGLLIESVDGDLDESLVNENRYPSDMKSFQASVSRMRKVHDDPKTSPEKKKKIKAWMDGAKDHKKKLQKAGGELSESKSLFESITEAFNMSEAASDWTDVQAGDLAFEVGYNGGGVEMLWTSKDDDEFHAVFHEKPWPMTDGTVNKAGGFIMGDDGRADEAQGMSLSKFKKAIEQFKKSNDEKDLYNAGFKAASK